MFHRAAARERFSRSGPNAGIVMRKGRYESQPCEAGAALDQPCRARAVVEIDGAPLCHTHARQAFDRTYSVVARLPIAAR